jgi:hypothetical protein
LWFELQLEIEVLPEVPTDATEAVSCANGVAEERGDAALRVSIVPSSCGG